MLERMRGGSRGLKCRAKCYFIFNIRNEAKISFEPTEAATVISRFRHIK
jgi:hypothetical protein